MDLKDLFEILPDIILYVTTGYLFILVFNFISLRKKMEDINGIFCASLAIGFVIKAILCTLKIRFSYYVNIVGLLAFSVLLGALLGYFINSKLCKKILKKLHVNRSINENIWHDIMDIDKRTMWIRAVSKEREQVIVGILVMVEEFQRFPQLLLQQYQIFDLEGNLVEDYIANANQEILIRTEDFENIDIVYDLKSSQYEKIEFGGRDDA